MVIKNKRLKEFIHANTLPVIRTRGNKLGVESIEFSEDGNSVKAYVKGTEKYEINFDGLASGMLMSSCTCPFDQGDVCKHQVAVANEIDASFNEKIVDVKPIEEKKYSSTGVFEIPFETLDDISDNKIKKYTTKNAFREAFSWGVSVEDITFNTKVIEAIVNEGYYRDLPKKVKLIIDKDKLELTCSCSYKNKNLCKHQVRVLVVLREQFSMVFLSEEKLNEIKEEKLKQFGFSLDNPKVDEYFEFGFSEGDVEVTPIKEGLLRLSSFNDFSIITEKMLNEEERIKSILPNSKKGKKNKKEIIAIGLYLNTPQDSAISLSLVPLKGNTNTQNELSTKITEIGVQEYILNKASYTEEEQFVLEKTLSLAEGVLYDNFKGDSENSDKEIINTLKELIPKLGDFKVYLIDGEYHKISRNNITLINLKLDSLEISFKLIEEENFYLLESYLKLNGRKTKLSKRKIGENVLLLKEKNTYFLVNSINEAKTMHLFKNNAELRFPKIDYTNYYEKLIKPLSEKYTVEIVGATKPKKKKAKESFKKQLFLSSLDNFILFKPAIGYKDETIQISTKKQFTSEEKGTSYIVPRDEKFEENYHSFLKELHPNFETQNQGFLFLEEEEFIGDMWFMKAFELLKENEVEVFGYNKLNLKYNINKPTISINVSSDIDWFDVNIEVAFGEQVVSLKDLKKNIINKDKYIRLKDGSIGVLPEEWLKKYLHLFRSGNVKKDSIGVSKYQFSVVDTLYEELENAHNLFDEHIKIKEKIANFETIENIRQPRGLNAKLRSYQKEGLKWLNFLDDFKLGGCLADDMGLGKTLQVISFIKHLKAKNKSKVPHLIVVPTSLIFNWNEEVNKFSPSLKILTLTGTKRNKDTSEFKKYDIVLTTYGVVINDIDYLKEYTFNYVILDESQAIKNPNSKRFKAVRLLKATNRLVLTGTPIENNTFDLYAQMTFVNPGLLGGIQHFKKEYATAIDKEKDKQAAYELKTLIDPFLLRRTKEQVATELPPKVEQFLYCTMGKEQRKLYEAYKNKYKDYLLGKIEDNGVEKSKMYVLEGLTKLRQICDSPSLLNDEEEYTNESVKIDELVKHITEKTNEHKILIFSQFTTMLGLIKKRLEEINIKFEYLDGKTRNRQQKVDNFQNDESIRVFLISLKAGGTGLNLTAADYVYIVDPWWNPAVEAQAIDRCYRIGQKKKVIAYKMICKDTIEEKIVLHQQNKKQVSDDLIQTEDSFVKSLNKESIESLFE